MRKSWISWLAFFVLGVSAARPVWGGPQGGELGNPYKGFESKIGRFSLEYPRDWQFFDLSLGANFTDTRSPGLAAPNFLTVMGDSAGGASTLEELHGRLLSLRPGVKWAKVAVGGMGGLEGAEGDVHFVYLLRAPGDVLEIRYRSSDESGRELVAHMLASFRAL